MIILKLWHFCLCVLLIVWDRYVPYCLASSRLGEWTEERLLEAYANVRRYLPKVKKCWWDF